MTGVRAWVLTACAVLLLGGCGSSTRQFAKVKIESNPPSAGIYIGVNASDLHDTTPCTLLLEEAGEFEIFFKKAGYLDVKKRVTVLERKTETGEVRLEALPAEMVVTLDPVEGEGSSEPPPAKPYYDD